MTFIRTKKMETSFDIISAKKFHYLFGINVTLNIFSQKYDNISETVCTSASLQILGNLSPTNNIQIIRRKSV